MKSRDFLSLFPVKKPIIAMLHLKGETHEETFERFRKELEEYIQGGVDAVIIETYFGTCSEMVQALEYTQQQHIGIPYGVNCLNVDAMGFHLAKEYGASFVQLDSVVGHVKPRDEESEQMFLDWMRSEYEGCVLGGVRFKYQPMLSVHSVEEDLQTAMGRCDAICVTEDRTGQETSVSKIKEFRNGIGSFPLVVAAGVTPENASKSLRIADAAIAGSYFKDTYHDDGEVSPEHIRTFMDSIRKIRKEEEK